MAETFVTLAEEPIAPRSMPLKKTDLYSNLWRSCDQLRGGMDASQYKDYILSLLFFKYVSDIYTADRRAVFEIPAGSSFGDICKFKGKAKIGDEINKALSKIATANDLAGVVNLVDFNDDEKLGQGQEQVDRLTKLIGIFEGLDFSRNTLEGDDLLGDAYEYLMRHFATESGKSKGQFYTPAEVSRIIAKVVGVRDAKRADQTVYDPTCGSGSLLIKVADEAPNVQLSLYGQEMDVSTRVLAKMNMVMHRKLTAEIAQGNTLANPQFRDKNDKLQRFDFAVANPPFSSKAWTFGVSVDNDPFDRFVYGTPPPKNGDYAFLLHLIASLKSSGRGAIILPHGVLFRGNAEGVIREKLIRHGYIEGIIALPPNLFYGTGIPACIIVIDKAKVRTRTGIFMIDASRGFRKDGNKNRLRHQDIHKVVDTYLNLTPHPKYSRMVTRAEIEANGFNLNIPRYIDTTEAEDIHDLGAHLQGGIPKRDVEALSDYWDVLPDLKKKLFVPDRPGYFRLRAEPATIKSTILSHPTFAEYRDGILKIFNKWRRKYAPKLEAFGKKDHPKTLIHEMSEDLLKMFLKTPLLDGYDIYQHLMSYCDETLQDDLFMISSDGWKVAGQLRRLLTKKEKGDGDDENAAKDEKADITVGRIKYRSELIPPDLVIERFFKKERDDIAADAAKLESIEQQIKEMAEENAGEDGLFGNVIDESGKIKKGTIKARMKEIENDLDSEDEYKALDVYMRTDEMAQVNAKTLRALEQRLAEILVQKYPKLTEAEIKALLVEDKWMATLETAIRTELDRLSQRLTGRVKTLADRYETPLSDLEAQVANLAKRVKKHLVRMEATQ